MRHLFSRQFSGVRAWRNGLSAIAVLSTALAVAHVTIGLICGPDRVKNIADGAGVYLGVAVASLVLLRVGTLIKAKLPGGLELEFASKLNRDTGDIKKLEIELEALKKAWELAKNKLAVPFDALPAQDAIGPHLPAKIRTNDQQKGRFGGQQEANGYRLSVVFRSDDRASVVDLSLIVDRPDDNPVQENVRFYLHQSFSPDEMTVVPKDGRATLDLLVLGGFTVGAWIPGPQETLLELDLSEVKGAPAIIREL